jgi:hypothetical protein
MHEIAASSSEPAPGEVLGTLSSRLIHDLKNKLAVVSGNAQFAEMSANDPQRVAQSVGAIRRAGEEALRIIEDFAALRQALPDETVPTEAGAVAAVLAAAMTAAPAWTFECAEELGGRVTLPPRWAAYILASHLRHCGVAAGRVEFGPHTIETREDYAFDGGPPPGRYFRIRIRHAAPPTPTPAPTPAARLAGLAMPEYIRRANGVVHRPAVVPGEAEVWLLLRPVSPTS